MILKYHDFLSVDFKSYPNWNQLSLSHFQTVLTFKLYTHHQSACLFTHHVMHYDNPSHVLYSTNQHSNLPLPSTVLRRIS